MNIGIILWGDQLPEEQLGQLKSGNACIVRNPIPMSYGEDVLEFTNIEAGENICVAGMELNVLKTLDGYDGYLGIGMAVSQMVFK